MKKLFLLLIACLAIGTYLPAYADSTISALSEVTGQPTPSDVSIIVDISDTSMGSTGTNKKIPLFRLTGLSGISEFTDNSYTCGGVTLTPEHFGESFSFTGATTYQIWYPQIDSSSTGWSIEFIKLGTGPVIIYTQDNDFINQSHSYTLPATGVSQVSIARLLVISGTTIIESHSYNTFSGTTQEYLSQINQSLSTGVTPTFAEIDIRGLIYALSGVSLQGGVTLYDSGGNTVFTVDRSGLFNSNSTIIGPSGVTTNNLRVDGGASIYSVDTSSGITVPASCIFQSKSGESLFISGVTLYYSDSTGVDHALH